MVNVTALFRESIASCSANETSSKQRRNSTVQQIKQRTRDVTFLIEKVFLNELVKATIQCFNH